jgi:hypothetical protein
MLDLYDELTKIVDALNSANLEFAVCGGVAMAIHGFTRATVDIDLFVKPDDVEAIESAVAPIGFTFRAKPMNFARGAMQIRRVSKIDPTDGDVLVLDLLLSTEPLHDVWETREVRSLAGRPLPVVSREGLIKLKRFRASDQDLVDIRRLSE